MLPAVGVPETTPVVGSMVAHDEAVAGMMAQVYGAVPPVAARAWEYGAPTVAGASDDVVTDGPDPTVSSSAAPSGPAPTAAQKSADGHATPASEVATAGTASGVQSAPPSDVPISQSRPGTTATHVDVVAHDTGPYWSVPPVDVTVQVPPPSSEVADPVPTTVHHAEMHDTPSARDMPVIVSVPHADPSSTSTTAAVPVCPCPATETHWDADVHETALIDAPAGTDSAVHVVPPSVDPSATGPVPPAPS